MNDRAKRLLEAHKQFEISRLSKDRIEDTISRETSAILDSIGSLTIEQVLSREEIRQYAVHEFQTAPVNQDARSLLTRAGENMLAVVQKSPAKLGELTTREVHDSVVEIVISSRDLRNNLAHDFVQSPLFKKILSDILYQAIRSFLSEDNALTKLPGVSSLFKFGQNLVNQTLPGLDENMGRVIREFIAKNIDNLTRYAESMLTGQLDEKSIRELAEHIWADYKEQKVSKFAADAGQIKSEDVSAAASLFWEHFRKTELGRDLAGAAVDAFFDHAGKKTIETALSDAGFHRERIVQTLVKGAAPGIVRAVESGAMGKYLDAKLGEFYNSKEAGEILG
ncbi:MAG TPA: hypothetical protein PKE49_08720 [Leptospiraceae bacterium]|jgi:hypothetical protein|nr:hypothetical protein [Leptospirales bacterium]HMU85214.1 hypothetical protein [Leptospiraceae bacterium]HMX56594.1 hypothetical protein [Leptospiraceae bacterium]HNL01458.1 hypothetical protein [Leptospiraceae bacterium]HNN59772.1 hypothetical protein [Leptospiraceae bacterium]